MYPFRLNFYNSCRRTFYWKMARELNLAFLLGVVCIGMTYGQTATVTKKPLKVMCYGLYGNFTSAPNGGSRTLIEICGSEIDVDIGEDLDVSSVMSLTFDVNVHCSELGEISKLQDVDIQGITASNPLKTVLRNTLLDMQLVFSNPSISDKKSDYCLWMVKLHADMGQNMATEYSSKKMPLALTLAPGPSTVLGLGETLNGPTLTSPLSISDRNLKSAVQMHHTIMVSHNQLPTLEDGAKYLAIAFLRYRPMSAPTKTGDDCNELTMFTLEDDDHYPYLSTSDYLVAIESFEASTALTVQSFDLTASLDDKLPEGICGNYDLVYMVDPLFTLFPPNQRCQYFKVLPVDIPCPSGTMEPGPFTCSIIQNVFGLNEAFFTTQGLRMDEVTPMMDMSYVSHFEREHHGMYTAWKESTKMVDGYHKVKVRGYPLLVLLWNLFLNGLTPNDCPLNSVTDDEVVIALKEFDGVQTSAFEDVTESIFNSVYMASEGLSIDLLDRDLGLLDENAGTFEEKVSTFIKKGVFMALKSLKESSTDTTAGMMYDDFYGEEKSIKDMVQPLFWHDMEPEWELLQFVKNITVKMVKMKKMYGTETSCFGKMYDKLIELIRNYYSDTGNFKNIVDISVSPYSVLFDYESMEEFKETYGLDIVPKWNVSQIRMNGCIQGIDRLSKMKCEDKVHISELGPELKTKVCLLKKFRMFMSEKIKAFGLTVVLRDWLSDRAKDKHEYPDLTYPMTLKPGSFSIWNDTMENDMHLFYESSILPTYTHVCRRKMASCRCESCDDYHHMGMPNMGTSSTSTTTESLLP